MSDDSAVEQRVEELLKKLGRREKVSLMSGRDGWHTVAVGRLGIPSLLMTDGPHAVRSCSPETGRKQGTATVFPNGVCFAASWNPELVGRVGRALAAEARALDAHILLGPCINIARTPLAGRNFETYSEDPFLTGRLAVSYVKAVQSQGIGTSLKHFACNNQEYERWRGSSMVDERTLREIYLPAFEMTVKEAQPWTVMCAYNRVNGIHASQNRYLLTDILKNEWGFRGAVVSDWGANHTTIESVEAGLDIEMPGPALYYGRLLLEGLESWQLEEPVVDEAVRRILRLVLRCERKGKGFKGAINTPEHQRIARELAEESITLLKNRDNVLPLQGRKVRKLAVIGLNAADMPIQGGGSACGEASHKMNPLDCLRKRLKGRMDVAYEPGYEIDTQMLPVEMIRLPGGKGAGLRAEIFTNTGLAGKPVVVRTETKIDFWVPGHRSYAPQAPGSAYSVRWSGQLVSARSGKFLFTMTHLGTVRCFIDGRRLNINTKTGSVSGVDDRSRSRFEVDLKSGVAREFRIEFVKTGAEDAGHLRVLVSRQPDADNDELIARSVELARKSDVAVVFAGLSSMIESEGYDRPHMDLPERQNRLIREVAQVCPQTVVVLNVGAPVTMPWIDDVEGVVLAYYPGQEGGEAVAGVLLGEVNPSGRLPVTFPVKYSDNPTFLNYPGARQVYYGEGIYVGYRYYDRKEVAPLFPFGFGLSYTTFEYGGLKVPAVMKAQQQVPVEVTVKNTGRMKGRETVQLYVSDLESSLPRPVRELKGFEKIELRPGASRRVKFLLDARAFSFYDPALKRWILEPGRFEIQIGSSSRNIHLKKICELR